jgi:hypothetical protein
VEETHSLGEGALYCMEGARVSEGHTLVEFLLEEGRTRV